MQAARTLHVKGFCQSLNVFDHQANFTGDTCSMVPIMAAYSNTPAYGPPNGCQTKTIAHGKRICGTTRRGLQRITKNVFTSFYLSFPPNAGRVPASLDAPSGDLSHHSLPVVSSAQRLPTACGSHLET